MPEEQCFAPIGVATQEADKMTQFTRRREMTAERAHLAGWGSTGKTRTTAYRRYNYYGRRTGPGLGQGARSEGAGWVRFCKGLLTHISTSTLAT